METTIYETAANGARWGYSPSLGLYFVCWEHEEPEHASAGVTPSAELAELWFERDYKPA